jgi:NAD(P)-dependent dehydrogenase (short-subunit alcohol dehydrogenase family)
VGKAVALITGASRGIGKGIALTLAAHGYDIAGVATSLASGIQETQREVEALGQRFLAIAADVSNLEDHERVVQETVSTFGQIDLLVNNAGVAPKVRLDILETTDESFDRLIDINLRGPFFLTQRVANQMIAQVKGGASYSPKIVFITSISSNTASPNRAEYCISKAGLSMAAQNYAVRLAEHGIHVYDIRPGITETDMTSGVKQKYDDLIAKGILLTPRWGTPEDVGKAVLAIAEGYLDYSTGTVIEVGGGFGVQRL